jgi:hypothetical protein
VLNTASVAALLNDFGKGQARKLPGVHFWGALLVKQPTKY